MPSILMSKAEDTRNFWTFHTKCLFEIRQLVQYPTGRDLSEIHWRAYFMDDKSELAAEMGDLFAEHIGNMEVEIGILEELSRLWQSNAIDQFNVVPSFTAITTWNLSKTLWKGTSLPRPLNHFCRFILCVFVGLFVCYLIRKHRNRYIIEILLHRMSRSVRFLNEHLQTFTEAHNRLTNRNFCITQSGHVAWVSLYAKEGDEICVFRGSRFPFVIRKSTPCHSKKYRLRGDCYMHGLMSEDLFEKARGDVEIIKLI